MTKRKTKQTRNTGEKTMNDTVQRIAYKFFDEIKRLKKQYDDGEFNAIGLSYGQSVAIETFMKEMIAYSSRDVSQKPEESEDDFRSEFQDWEVTNNVEILDLYYAWRSLFSLQREIQSGAEAYDTVAFVHAVLSRLNDELYEKLTNDNNPDISRADFRACLAIFRRRQAIQP